ncbi:MAG: cell division protein ZapA [Pseudomonadota bacterium]
MAEVTVEIGGRSFRVACDDGQEQAVMAAAGLLDGEAQTLVTGIGGTLPESRMLLMSGLMLADRLQALANGAAAPDPAPAPEPAPAPPAPAAEPGQMGLFDGEDGAAARRILGEVATALETLADTLEARAAEAGAEAADAG